MYIPLLQSCDSAADVVYNTAELVSENIALLKLDNGAVKQMQIRTANCGSGDLDNDIAGLENGGLGHLDDLNGVLAHPCESLHLLARLVRPRWVVGGVGDILCSGRVVGVTNSLFGLRGRLGHHLGRVFRLCSWVRWRMGYL
jgi:hypothetical protein